MPVTIGAQVVMGQSPTLTIAPPAQVGRTNAVITGTVNPNGLATGFTVQFGFSTAYDRWTRYYQVGSQSAPVDVTAEMIELTPDTTYHYRLMATNSAGIGLSEDMTLTTAASPTDLRVPTVTVDPATEVTSNLATVTGTVNPHGLPTGVSVQYGTSTAYGFWTAFYPVPVQETPAAVTIAVTGLTANTTYHFRLMATNIAGIGYSADLTLTTTDGPSGLAPRAETTAADNVTTNSAILWGSVDPGGQPTAYYFRWGTTIAYGNVLPLRSAHSHYGERPVSEVLTGLSPGTTYHYQLVATNSGGVAFGGDETFTTLSETVNGNHVFTFAQDNGAIAIVGYEGPGGEVSIPGTINGLPVTIIGSGAFASKGLTGVTIPNGVTKIGSSAFSYCSDLVSVTIPGSVTNIGSEAFAWCTSLRNLTIQEGVISIGGTAFYMCINLTSVTVPDSVLVLEDGAAAWVGPVGAFGYTGLTNVVIGKGLTYLAPGTFANCGNLLSVLFKGDAPVAPYALGFGAFRFADSATVYYLPGTTGWGPTFSDRPTMLWNAQPRISGPGFGMQPNGFGFHVEGTPGIPVLIEASSDFCARTWVPLQTSSLTNGSLYFTDPDRTNSYSSRYYRVRWP